MISHPAALAPELGKRLALCPSSVGGRETIMSRLPMFGGIITGGYVGVLLRNSIWQLYQPTRRTSNWVTAEKIATKKPEIPRESGCFAITRTPVSTNCQASRCLRSRSTRVSVMQSADLPNGDDLALRRRFHLTWGRRVAIQRKVRSRIVVVVEILGQDSMQMSLVQHDHVVQAFAAY